MQVIVVCETRSSSKSDYKYIKSVFDYFYKPRSFAIKKIFASSKPELIKQDKKISKEIADYNGESKVIIFADVDDNDGNLNKRIEDYATMCGYELVWMNGDIEEVFLGHKVKGNKKTDEANKYLIQYLNILPKLTNLQEKDVLSKSKTSNILLVLDRFLERK